MTALASSSTPREAVEAFVALMVDDPTRGTGAAAGPGTRTGAHQIRRRLDAHFHRAVAEPAEPRERPPRANR